jgi:transposase
MSNNPLNKLVGDLSGKVLTEDERMLLGMAVVSRHITIKQLALRHNLNYKTVTNYVRKVRLGQRPHARPGRPRKLDPIGITNCVDYISHDYSESNKQLKVRIRLESKLTTCRRYLRPEIRQLKLISRRTVGRYVDLVRSQIITS